LNATGSDPALYNWRSIEKMRGGSGLSRRGGAPPTKGARVNRDTRRSVGEEEAVVPELVDRLEYQTAELDRLRADLASIRGEREKLQTDLMIAERWVSTLARELELADAQLKEMRPLYSRIGTPPRPA
jgi:chromosome segregation ATPase